MSDIALKWDPEKGSADFGIVANDLEVDDGLRTAVILSLYTNRRAEPGDALPPGTSDRQGWWADEFNDVPGDKFGSRLWLLARSKRQPTVLSRAEEFAREALAWLVEDKVATSVTASAEWLVKQNGFALVIGIQRPHADPASYRFGFVWAAEGARS